MFFVVVGPIYLGWATPTKAASMGVFRRARAGDVGARAVLEDAAGEGTMRNTAMIMLIIIATQFLNFVLASIGLTHGIGKLIGGLSLGKYGWDAIWWRVVLTILIEAALVTPPVGLNLYVVQSLRERGPTLP
jgi:TRAP-type C4-dicarboxylate transport system permease large subunit